jgi:hypothetical protein
MRRSPNNIGYVVVDLYVLENDDKTIYSAGKFTNDMFGKTVDLAVGIHPSEESIHKACGQAGYLYNILQVEYRESDRRDGIVQRFIPIKFTTDPFSP